MKKSIRSFFLNKKFMLKGISGAFLFILILGMSYVYGDFKIKTPTALAAECTASLNWNSSQISKGVSATETWSVSGAESVIGECHGSATGLAGSTGEKDIGASGSYTFNNIQGDVTCSVKGMIGEQTACSASKTVQISVATPPPSGGNDVMCYFYSPDQAYTAYSGLDPNYNKPRSSYNAILAESKGIPFDSKPISSIPVTFPLKWKVVKADKALADRQGYISGGTVLSSSDGYTATLSSPGRPDGSNAIGEHSVALDGSESATIGNQGSSDFTGTNNATYTLKVSKNGSPVTNCYVNASNQSSSYYLPSAHTPGAFPGPGSYPLSIKGVTTTANYNYSPQVPEVTVDEYAGFPFAGIPKNFGLNLYMGQYHQNIYFGIASYVDVLGDGRFDISDPFNPKNTDLVAAGGGLDRQGPLSDAGWGHAPVNKRDISAVAESPDAEARLSFAYGTFATPYAALGWSAGSPKGYFGQQIDPELANTLGEASYTAQQVVDYTSSGNYFAYFVGSRNIPMFDLSSLSGSANPPFLQAEGSIGWSGITDFKILRDPTTDKHYIIARGDGSTPGKPIIHLAEQSSETGKPLRPKVINMNISQVPHPPVAPPIGTPPNIQSFTNLKPFAFNGKLYVLATEDYIGNQDTTGCTVFPSCNNAWLWNTFQGTLVLGLYQLNPTSLTLSKISTIKMKDVPYFTSSYLEVSGSLDGDISPILISLKQTRAGENNSSPIFKDRRLTFYSLKQAFTPSASLEFSDPDFIISDYENINPIKPGDLVQNLFPYKSFLKNENGKVNMYFYRPAYRHVGSRTGFDAPYQVLAGVTATFPMTNYGNRGDAALRVDKIDVTSVTSSTGVTPTDGTRCGAGDLFDRVTGVSCGIPIPGSSCILSDRRFQLGSTGEDVKQLQILLGITADGNFGPQTRQAVIDFQKANGLTADGVVGPITQGAVIIYCKEGSIKTYQTPLPTEPTVPIAPSGPASSPVIIGVNGPQSLRINQEGTWTVTATDTNNDDLSWSVDWGEGRSVQICKLNPPRGTKQNWSYTASHSWVNSGNYTVTVFVGDCKGGTAQRSFTVNVN